MLTYAVIHPHGVNNQNASRFHEISMTIAIFDDSNMFQNNCPKLRKYIYTHGLVQQRCNSSALAMELRLSCTNPMICVCNYVTLTSALFLLMAWHC